MSFYQKQNCQSHLLDLGIDSQDFALKVEQKLRQTGKLPNLDLIKKVEVKINKLRDEKRKQILADMKKRKQAPDPTRDTGFQNFTYLNIRDINSHSKQLDLTPTINEELYHSDILMMSETHLRRLHLKGWRSYQTSFNSKGGCWQAARSRLHFRSILTNKNCLSWPCVEGWTEVHLLTLYVTCDEELLSKKILLKALQVLDAIKERNPSAQIVIAGHMGPRWSN